VREQRLAGDAGREPIARTREAGERDERGGLNAGDEIVRERADRPREHPRVRLERLQRRAVLGLVGGRDELAFRAGPVRGWDGEVGERLGEVGARTLEGLEDGQHHARAG
jgi:hypothetical protein